MRKHFKITFSSRFNGVFFGYGALLKLVASSLLFLYTKILCLHTTVNNSRFNVQNLDLKLLENYNLSRDSLGAGHEPLDVDAHLKAPQTRL